VKNYYKILEVTESATQVEIKKSYRSLAKKYHPDKSSAPSAAQLFSEINEAYEVLSDHEQKGQYDQRRNRSQGENARPKSHGNYSNRRPTRPVYSSPKDQLDLKPYVPYFRKVSWIALAIAFSLFIDFVIPRNEIDEQIIKVENVIARSRRGRQAIVARAIITSSGAYQINKELSVSLKKNQPIKVFKTRLLDIATSVNFLSGNSSEKYIIAASIHRNFSFSWIILLISSVVGTFVKKSSETIINLGVVNGVLILLVIYFTAVS
jgi:hypothetical protein